MARLFLSYRRSDTGAYADRLAQRLSAFQFEAVFVDREAIGLGDNFADRLRTALSRSTAVLVLIGSRWIDARDADGRRRLEDSTDWVRREIALALSQGLPVIPVLFDAPPRLAAKDLPADLAFLATSQGYDINGNYFDRDADDLGRRLETTLVGAARAAAEATDAATTPATPKGGLLRQLQIMWQALSVVTLAVALTPALVPALPSSFWLFPGTMTTATFLWWLYWLGESTRPARSRMA